MDILDILHPSANTTYKGIYFSKLPTNYTVFTVENGGVEDFKDRLKPFFYEYVAERTKQHLYPLQNLSESVNVDATIRTKDGKNFSVDGFIRLADGNFYSILTISQDMQQASKWAAKYLPQPVGATYTIRLAKYDYAIQDNGENAGQDAIVFPTVQ